MQIEERRYRARMVENLRWLVAVVAKLERSYVLTLTPDVCELLNVGKSAVNFD